MSITRYLYLDPLIDSESDILAIRSNAMALYASGKTVMSWTGEGTTSTKAFVAPIEDILAECRYALKTGWPQKYGYIANSSRQMRI